MLYLAQIAKRFFSDTFLIASPLTETMLWLSLVTTKSARVTFLAHSMCLLVEDVSLPSVSSLVSSLGGELSLPSSSWTRSDDVDAIVLLCYD